MIPKIFAVVKSVVQGKMKMAPSEHMHAGYQRSFSEEHEGLNMESLSYFPTDSEISEDLAIASKQANSLIHFTGMGHLDPSQDEIIDADFPEFSFPPDSEASDGKYLEYVVTSAMVIPSFQNIISQKSQIYPKV